VEYDWAMDHVIEDCVRPPPTLFGVVSREILRRIVKSGPALMSSFKKGDPDPRPSMLDGVPRIGKADKGGPAAVPAAALHAAAATAVVRTPLSPLSHSRDAPLDRWTLLLIVLVSFLAGHMVTMAGLYLMDVSVFRPDPVTEEKCSVSADSHTGAVDELEIHVSSEATESIQLRDDPPAVGGEGAGADAATSADLGQQTEKLDSEIDVVESSDDAAGKKAIEVTG
jgi:hypothetical protein